MNEYSENWGSQIARPRVERSHLLSAAVIKHPDPKQAGKERVHFCLQVIAHHRGKPSRNLEAGTRSRDHGGVLFSGLLPLTCSAICLI